MNPSDINPKNDGIDHINIYSHGKTELGQLLSNFAHSPFTHSTYGKFNSIEGLWYWLKCKRAFGIEYIQLKLLYGFEAKQLGKQLFSTSEEELPNFPDELFKEDILEGIRCKLRQNKDILNLLVESTLPLTHYYTPFKGTGTTPKFLPQHQWQIDEIERIRKVSKEFLIKNNKEKF